MMATLALAFNELKFWESLIEAMQSFFLSIVGTGFLTLYFMKTPYFADPLLITKHTHTHTHTHTHIPMALISVTLERVS